MVSSDGTFPNQRWVYFRRGDAVVELMRYWDSPRNPGYPMAVASQREVVAGGRITQLLVTSMFEGAPKQVSLCWFTGKGYDVEYGVRIVFENCTDPLIAEVLSRVVVVW